MKIKKQKIKTKGGKKMKIKEQKVKIRNIVEGYLNDAAEGVTAFDGQLDVRPPYQREFVYKDKKRDEVIRTVMKGFPLSIMYWVDRGEEFEDDDEIPRYEVLDGQQRTISICEYVDGSFSIDDQYFANLPKDKQDLILNYELNVYICQGTDSEKLDWFKVINIAGEQLTDQELRNAVYAGPWVSDAKRYFSKPSCVAEQIGGEYMHGSCIRQDYLETVIKWAADAVEVEENEKKPTVEKFMASHQHNPTARKLWSYFTNVIDWVQSVFGVKTNRYMKGLDWGFLYNEHGQRDDINPIEIQEEVVALMSDEEVTKKSGIYEYVLSRKEKFLSLRAFDRKIQAEAYEKQGHKCAVCGKEFEFDKMHADHITPWSKGGRSVAENCQMLCRDCNLKKGAQE